MIASDWVARSSMVVGGQGALVGHADLPVPPDRRGQGQQPLGDPDIDAGQGSSLVAFQAELVFEGVEGALDPLAPAAQRPVPAWFISPVGTQQDRAIAGDQLLKVPAGKALVGHDDQPRPQPPTLVVQHGRDHLTLAEFGVGQAPGNREAIGGGQHIEPEPPEEAVVTLAVAIAGMAGQRRALDRLAGGRTRHRGGVEQPELVAAAGGVGNRNQRRSEPQPSRTWATARQTSSASLSFGGRPGPIRWPSRSSMVTYSAMTRSSRQACTRPPWRSTLLQQRQLSAASSPLSPLDTLAPIRKQSSSSTPLGWVGCWVQPGGRAGQGALAEGTRAGPTGEQELQLAQCLEGGKADARAFGSSRSKVTKACATDTRVTWWCQPCQERPSKWSSPSASFSSRESCSTRQRTLARPTSCSRAGVSGRFATQDLPGSGR